MRNCAGRVREPDGTPESSPGHLGDLADGRSAGRSADRFGARHRQISRLLERGEWPALPPGISRRRHLPPCVALFDARFFRLKRRYPAPAALAALVMPALMMMMVGKAARRGLLRDLD